MQFDLRFLAVIVLFGGCVVDPSDVIESGDGPQFVQAALEETSMPSSSVLIRVVDGEGPLALARVSTSDAVYTTDGAGYILIHPREGRFIARVDARGHASSIVEVKLSEGVHAYEQVHLHAHGPRLALDSTVGGTVEHDGVRVDVPPRALVTESGERVEGLVEVTITAVDPSAVGPDELPGPTRGQDGGESTPMALMAMAEISFWQGDRPLQLGSEATAHIELELPDELRSTLVPGMEIPAWWLDLDEGAWVREGTGRVSQNASSELVWSLDVEHFTWYSSGDVVNDDFECFIIRAVDAQGDPVPNQGFQMKTVVGGNGGVFYDGGYTDSESENILSNCAMGPLGASHVVKFSGSVEYEQLVPAGKGGFGACEVDVPSEGFDGDMTGPNANCVLIEVDLPPPIAPEVCLPGTYRECVYSGPPNTEGDGACHSGYDYCIAGGTAWSECSGEIIPQIETCGSPFDDDCDGVGSDIVASTCSCVVGSTVDCYSAPASTLNVGTCHAGKRYCSAISKKYGSLCFDEVVPIAEKCGTAADEDCDGLGACVPPSPPFPQVHVSQTKQLHINWAPALGATSYRVFESIDVGLAYEQVGEALLGHARSLDVPLHFRANASYYVRACNAHGCTDSAPVALEQTMASGVGYLKASNSDPSEFFGSAVATSDDGQVVAVGAWGESSAVENGIIDPADDSASRAGAVHVFREVAGDWMHQAFLKAFNADRYDSFGWSVALSGDGNVLAVGAPRESSASSSDPNDDTLVDSGAVYVFRWLNGNWMQEGYLKASNAGMADWFGVSVALSEDGSTLAVGAYREDSNAVGVDGSQGNNLAADSGAVYVYRYANAAWEQQAYIKPSNTGAYDYFGWSVSLSDSGKFLAVSSYGEDSAAVGVGGDQGSNAASFSGAAYVFSLGSSWVQSAYVKASNTGVADYFGTSVALDGDGDILVVGAYGEDSVACGVNGDQQNNGAVNSGALYAYRRDMDGVWAQEAYIKSSNSGASDVFGYRGLALDDEGATLAAGAYYEDGGQAGVGANQNDESASESGSVYVFTRAKGGWEQRSYVKAPNPDAGDRFGGAISLSGNGETLCVGAANEASNAVGVNGLQVDNSIPYAGAVYLY